MLIKQLKNKNYIVYLIKQSLLVNQLIKCIEMTFFNHFK